jgi:ferric-dicitrate binding protein FerR (iron transport regulator)
MSVEERATFDVWLRDRANAAALAEIERVWTLMEVARDHCRAEAPAVLSTRSKSFARPALVALVCLVSLGLGALSYSANASFWTKLDWTDR